MRDVVKEATDEHTNKCFTSVLFGPLMVEKIKTYSLNYDALAILSDELHDEYLRKNVYDYESDRL